MTGQRLQHLASIFAPFGFAQELSFFSESCERGGVAARRGPVSWHRLAVAAFVFFAKMVVLILGQGVLASYPLKVHGLTY